MEAVIRYDDNSKYEGLISEEKVPHGNGTLTKWNGRPGRPPVITGKWSNGFIKKEGVTYRVGCPVSGWKVWTDGIRKYEGFFVDGLLQGLGTIKPVHEISEIPLLSEVIFKNGVESRSKNTRRTKTQYYKEIGNIMELSFDDGYLNIYYKMPDEITYGYMINMMNVTEMSRGPRYRLYRNRDSIINYRANLKRIFTTQGEVKFNDKIYNVDGTVRYIF